jgi:hypothetical protein
VFENAPISTLFSFIVSLHYICKTSDVLQVFQRLLQHDDGPVTPRVVQRVAEHVVRDASFVDDPLLQRMKFSPTWCGKILRQFASSGMPDSATRLRAPVVHSVSLQTICPSNSSSNSRVLPVDMKPLFLKISSALEGVNS